MTMLSNVRWLDSYNLKCNITVNFVYSTDHGPFSDIVNMNMNMNMNQITNIESTDSSWMVEIHGFCGIAHVMIVISYDDNLKT